MPTEYPETEPKLITLLRLLVGLQVPKPCPCGNMCSLLGYSRCHGLFQVIFLRRHWRRCDNTLQNENNWNVNESHTAGDNPEYGPGAIFGASGVYTSSASASSTGSPSPHYFRVQRAVVQTLAQSRVPGGVVGGIAVVPIAVAAIFYLRRRPQAPSAAIDDAGASQPLPDGGTDPSSSSGSPLTMRFYDPNDPATFPGYPGSQSQVMPQGSTASQIGSGSTLATTQTSSQGPKGYHGFPMPSA